MSRQINQPINQVRLTNVAVVRMTRGGKRFEIACYRNKVVDYRQGLETDLSEVLQTERVFTNVSKGEFAKAKDLQKVFGTKDEEEIARMILSKGQVQVSDKERSQQLDKTNAQIAEWISKNCVQPSTDRPYTISQIRHAMQQANFSVHPTKPLKRQYLDCVKMLQEVIPIERAKMELLLLIPDGEESTTLVETTMKEHEVEWSIETGASSSSSSKEYKMVVDPSFYRVLNEAIQDVAGAHIEIATQVVTKQGDVQLETELDHPTTIDHPTVSTMEDPMDDLVDGLAELQVVSAQKEVVGSVTNEDDVDPNTNQRKQQKKSKKKNRKNQRRDESDILPPTNSNDTDDDISPVIVPPTIAAPPGAHHDHTDDANASSSRKSCNTCGGSFDTPASYRSHFKSDWHRFNQKLKLKGAAPISEQEFLLCDSDNLFGGISGDSIL